MLLAKTHQANGDILLLGNAELLEPLLYLPSRLEMREAVLYLDVLHCRKLGKEPQFLKEYADMALTEFCPVLCLEQVAVLVVEENLAVVIRPVADDEAAKRTFSCAALSLYEVSLASLKRYLLAPDFALYVSPAQVGIVAIDSFYNVIPGLQCVPP